MRLLTIGSILFLLLIAGPNSSSGREGNDAPSDTNSIATAPPPGNPGTGADSTPAKETDGDQMKLLLQQQAAQYEEQKEINAEQQQRLAKMEGELKALRGSTAAPIAAVAAVPNPVIAPATNPLAFGDAKTDSSPLYFRIGDANFTPGGFLDFTTVYRSKDVGSGIGTSFGAIPFAVASSYPAAGLSELRMSAQNSRMSLKVDSQVGSSKAYGYIETDFLGNNATTMYVTSNSATFRIRAAFVDVSRGKWELLGGQGWSLLTPNRKGLSPMPSDMFISMDADSNYQLGLVWSRQAQLRIVYHPNSSWTLGFSAENPEQFIGSALTLPMAFASTQADTNGASFGANTNTPNLHPDFITKIAYDRKIGGRSLHMDAAGIYRTFKVNTFTQATSTAPPINVNSISSGAGGSLNSNLELFKNFHLIENAFWSDGGGRYIFGLAPDFVVRPATTGRAYTISPDHSGSGILGFEWQAFPQIMVYGYDSVLYVSRNYSAVPLNTSCGPLGYCGYGFPGSNNANNRDIQEATLGLSRTIWSSPEIGKLVFHSQASYMTRSPWFVAVGTPKEANLVMGYVALKYVLP
jgi:hypothetical protein